MDWIKNLSTSKNLTVMGIVTIIGAVAAAVKAIVDGDPSTNPDWAVTIMAVWGGLAMILGKGAASTGGTVPATEEAKARVAQG